ncbi:hypothetical protein [Dyadobacter sp. CY347]|uniref:hypothetical protein n=1 Tax=Dyadobacter sp. CY347 TaxID=2909336 RepID=UPI001F315A42|nr:hypothetical protein [Dyadobacter sp. CY347]MCF2489969.1 hypothetical protein [Dyadobacter sp. CY347]
MKTNRLIFVIAALITMLGSCKMKDITKDSPLITVVSPTRNQDVKDITAFNVEAIIEPKDKSVMSYYVMLLDHDARKIFDKEIKCDCKGEKRINVKESIEYDVNQSTDVLLRILVFFEDGTITEEEVPFKMIDTKI